jgi:hypothetical protein
MFDADIRSCSTSVLEHGCRVRGILIDHWLEGLHALGGDVAAIFPHGPYRLPDRSRRARSTACEPVLGGFRTFTVPILCSKSSRIDTTDGCSSATRRNRRLRQIAMSPLTT